MTDLRVLQGDIATLDVDVIVNAAAPGLGGGTGVSRAIHGAAGPDLFAAATALDPVGRGDAGITPGFALKARWVVHAVGPVYVTGKLGEDKVLARCYRRALELCVEKQGRSIAFPAISTGAYRFPKDQAARIAVETVRAFVGECPDALDQVLFVATGGDNIRELTAALSAQP
ncbi:macro domain-containing protein [Niveispirillum lacus]|uniref:macro domain-containing protein n=1 Tax=Niveispirillum lacus TaxID=1981099 RepID=UPI001FEA9E8A|nr:macro domain-containing protein [Niveispirillum lacus]